MKSCWYLCSLALSFVVLLPIQSSAQVTKNGDAYLLRVKFTKGQILKYDVSLKVTATDLMDKMVDFNGPVQFKILDTVKGYATIRQTSGPSTVGLDKGRKSEYSYQMDPRSRIVGTQFTRPFEFVRFPAEPKKVGESWSESMPKLPKEIIEASIRYTLRSVTKEAATIDVAMSMKSFDIGNTSARATYVISTKDGTILSATMSMEMTDSDLKRKPNTAPDVIKVNYKATRR